MSLQKDFKWSDKVYTMKEFVDVFTYRLPQIIFIAVGWDGKDVEHTFSGDEASKRSLSLFGIYSVVSSRHWF